MKLDLWKPLKINNPLLKDIFNIPIDGKVLPNGKIQVHPLIIFENKETKTYYCIRLQTANKLTIKNDILIDNKTYQVDDYWKNHQGVAVTKDVFIIDKELLENNIDKAIYENTFELNDSDKNLIIQDLDKRINSTPPNLNILEISNNSTHNLVLYTNNKQITNQFYSTISPNNKLVDERTKNYYIYHFNKDKFLKDINNFDKEHTEEVLENIKQSINNAIKIQDEKLKAKNILSEFDKTPTSFEDSEVIKEYKKSFNENKVEDKLNENKKKENKLKH